MGITRLSILRPLTMLMIILGLVVLGYRSLTELQVDRYPAVDFPYVSVVTVFPGAGPEDVEDLVVKPIEDAVAGIPGIDQLFSTSQEGVGFVVVAFKEGVNGDQAAIEVERQVATVRGQLPSEALDPSVIKADINAIPILEIILSGPQGQDDLFEVARDEIRPRLQTIKGVAAVNISGGREREIHIEADPAKLAAFGIPLETVQQALTLNNLTFPVGSIEEGRQKTSIRSVGDFTDLKQIEDVVVAGGPSPFASGGGGRTTPGKDTGGLVYLHDVASVQEGFADKTQVLRYNGVDAVNISVIKTSDANTIEMADSVRQAIEQLRNDLPAGAQLTIVADDSQFTRESVAAVQEDLILAILITGLVMLVFLHTIRSTFIVILAIPTSIMSTFLVMWALGFSLNVLTLLALTLTIGILVDDSIVVIENIERHLKMKKKPKQAALDGRAQIGLAAITISLVDVAVYVPVAFTSGIVGQFFRSYGITIATAVLFSLFVSFTLTPMLASLWMKDESEPEREPRGLRKVFSLVLWPVARFWKGFIIVWNAGFRALTRLYAATIRFVLKNFLTQSLAVLVAAAAVALGGYMVVTGIVGSEFFPQEDDAKFTVNIEMPAGTNLQTTDLAGRQAERIILEQVPETVSILTRVGSGDSSGFFSGGGASNSATLLVQVVDKGERKRSTTDIINELRPEIKKIPEANISLVLSSIMGAGMGGAVQIQVFGEDPNVLIDLANQVEAVMRNVPGTADVLNTGSAQSPETRLLVDRDRALNLGLSPGQVAGTLRTALSGTDVGKFKRAGATDINITLRANAASRSNLDHLLQLPLGYRNGQAVKLDQIASVERTLAPAVINRTDRQRQLTVSAGVAGRTSGDVTNDVEAAIQSNVQFPEGYGFRLSGASEMQRESFADLTSSLGLGILLIYMLLVALFQSWLHPLAIMFSLPVATVGAFGGLWLTGYTLNLMSLLGIILLAGIVTKNAILLVDFTNELRRKEGYSRKEALIEAGRLRLRPILMTSVALVFAMLPVLLGRGAGSEVRAPLAAVVIGGNITSTLLTLILVPVVYNFFDGGSRLVSITLRRLLGGETGQDEAGEDRAPAPKPAPQPQPGAAVTPSSSGTSSGDRPSAPRPRPDAA
jgi:HAE1 family hydrophobic/amphiphilic exporter-1